MSGVKTTEESAVITHTSETGMNCKSEWLYNDQQPEENVLFGRTGYPWNCKYPIQLLGLV